MKVSFEGDFAKIFKNRQDDLANDAVSGTKTLQDGFLELLDMQTKEIARLTGILKDATQIPERHFTHFSVSSAATREGDRVRHVASALANDGSAWAFADFMPGQKPGPYQRWTRVQPLPQAVDEVGPTK